jgi:hypothetical protein
MSETPKPETTVLHYGTLGHISHLRERAINNELVPWQGSRPFFYVSFWHEHVFAFWRQKWSFSNFFLYPMIPTKHTWLDWYHDMRAVIEASCGNCNDCMHVRGSTCSTVGLGLEQREPITLFSIRLVPKLALWVVASFSNGILTFLGTAKSKGVRWFALRFQSGIWNLGSGPTLRFEHSCRGGW